MAKISEAYKRMDDAYGRVCQMFCESARTTEPSELFGPFKAFVNAYKVKTKTLFFLSRSSGFSLQEALKDNENRRRKESQEAAKAPLAVRVKPEPNLLQSISEEVAAVAAAKLTPATWKVKSDRSPPKKKKEKKEKKEKKKKKKKGEVMVDERGMLQIAGQTASAAPPPPPPPPPPPALGTVPLSVAHSTGAEVAIRASVRRPAALLNSVDSAYSSQSSSSATVSETTPPNAAVAMYSEVTAAPADSEEDLYAKVNVRGNGKVKVESDALYDDVEYKSETLRSELPPPLPSRGYLEVDGSLHDSVDNQ